MKTMLFAGGAEAGKYGPAMQIYTAIQKASPRAAVIPSTTNVRPAASRSSDSMWRSST